MRLRRQPVSVNACSGDLNQLPARVLPLASLRSRPSQPQGELLQLRRLHLLANRRSSGPRDLRKRFWLLSHARRIDNVVDGFRLHLRH